MTEHLPAIVEVTPDDALSFGPAMLALNSRQQAFVLAHFMTGQTNNALHAKMAGYEGPPSTLARTGFRLAHDPAVIAAMVEEATKRMHSGAIMAVSRLMHIAENAPEMKDQLKAIGMILNRAGLHEKTEHKLTVKRESSEAEMLQSIEKMAAFLGIDPKKLTGNVKIIEGEFTAVEPKAAEDAPALEAPEEIDWNEPVEGEQ